MAADLNQCSFIGRLGRDVETKTLANGDLMGTFSLAVGESYINKSGEKIKNTEWINIVCYRKLAEICSKYIGKGSLVFVQGKMKTSKYVGKDGSDKQSTKVVIDTMQILAGKANYEPAPESNVAHEDMDIPF